MKILEGLYRLIGKRALRGRLEQCPQESEFLNYSEGRLSNKRRAQLESHFVDCENCREFLALYAQLSEERPHSVACALEPMSDEAVREQAARILALVKEDEFNKRQKQFRAQPSRYITYARLAAMAVVVLAVAGTIYLMLRETSQDDAAMEALAMATRKERRIEPRISGDLPWSTYLSVRGEEDDDKLALERAINKAKLAEAQSASVSSRLVLARIYLATGQSARVAQALEILQNLAERGERSPELLNDTGVALLQQGRHPEAVAMFTEALEQDPNYDEALFNRALANYYAGLNEAARKDWTEFINKSSEEKWKAEAQNNLDRLNRSSAP
jgi:tetratricopeptide (TPR) repeat protein